MATVNLEDVLYTQSDDGVDYRDVASLTGDDILRKVFPTTEDAYDFYQKLGRFHGFGIRKGDMFKNGGGNLIRRRFFCNREGLRHRKHYNRVDRRRPDKPEIRKNCEARMCIYLDRSNNIWRVKKVITKHNHALTHHGMVHLIPNFRSMTEAAKAQINGMQGCGISTLKTMQYLAGMAGGYSLVGFQKKDAYNYVDRSRRARIADVDANSAIVYLEGKVDADPISMARYNVTVDDMLANLFWADGGSRLDYQYFGDVLAFDSTYKKNKYNRLLVIFSGCNNHKQTCIFGFGLVLDESISSYTWLLENFLEVMCNKVPSVVVTDGDDSIREAVQKVFPGATHRLCAWHIEKNVTSNVKDVALCQLFNRWLYADMGVDDFETEWAEASAEYELHDTLWGNQVYGKREMWSNAYLRDKFCAGFRTTSRCEGINSVVKKFLQSKHTMLELVQNLELLLREFRNNELLSQFRSIYGDPVLTTSLDSLERFAATVYTRSVFNDVKKEIKAVASVNFVGVRRSLTTKVYTADEYRHPGQPIVVLCDRNMGRLQCDCHFWDTRGYPCKHMFFVIKHEHVMEVPKRLVLKRWTKDAKHVGEYVEKKYDDGDREFLLRHGALHSASHWLFFLGAQQFSLFTEAMKGLQELRGKLEDMFSKKANGKGEVTAAEVRDPDVVRTKGAPRVQKWKQERRKCAACKLLGHTKRTCPASSTKNKAKRARTTRMEVGDARVGAACTGRQTTKVTKFEVTGSNDDVGHPTRSSHPHLMHDLNFGTIDGSRVDNAELGSDGLGLRAGTFGGIDVQDAKTSKLMDMVASLAKAL